MHGGVPQCPTSAVCRPIPFKSRLPVEAFGQVEGPAAVGPSPLFPVTWTTQAEIKLGGANCGQPGGNVCQSSRWSRRGRCGPDPERTARPGLILIDRPSA